MNKAYVCICTAHEGHVIAVFFVQMNLARFIQVTIIFTSLHFLIPFLPPTAT